MYFSGLCRLHSLKIVYLAGHLEAATFVTKKRGLILIDQAGQSYFRTNSSRSGLNSTWSWRCSQYRSKCKVKVFTDGELIVRRMYEHNHADQLTLC